MDRFCNDRTCYSCSKESTRGIDDVRPLLRGYHEFIDEPHRYKRYIDVKHATTKPSLHREDLICVECFQKELASKLGYPPMSAGLGCENSKCVYYEGFSGWQPSLSEIFGSGSRATNNPRARFTEIEGLERLMGSGLRLREINTRQTAPARSSMDEPRRFKRAFSGRFGSR